MKSWNKANLIWLAVMLAAAIVGFSALVICGDYILLHGKAWPCIFPTLIGTGYGIWCFIKKYLPDKEDEFRAE